MSALPFLTGESAWLDIQKYFEEEGSGLNIQQLFEKDPARFDKFRWVHISQATPTVVIQRTFTSGERSQCPLEMSPGHPEIAHLAL